MYYAGGALGCGACASTGLHGLGLTDPERFRQNALAETLARQWDRDALRYLRARTGDPAYATTFPVPGPVYEPNGGPISGWATAPARADADARLMKTLSYLAFQSPEPTGGGTTQPTTPPGPGTYQPGAGQPLPEVTVLGSQSALSPGVLVALLGGAYLVLTSRKQRA